MTTVKGFDCQLQVLYSFIFVYGADSLFVTRPFAIPKFEEELKVFLQCHYVLFIAQTMMSTGVLLFRLELKLKTY